MWADYDRCPFAPRPSVPSLLTETAHMKIAVLILVTTLCVGLVACAGWPTATDREADAGSGPTVYGKVSVSVDHVETR